MGKEYNAVAVEQIESEATAIDVAYWFLTKDRLDQKKAQKLTYYAQAWSLALYDKDIIEGIEFQAWVHGPVNKEIRDEFMKFRWTEFTLTFEDKEKAIERNNILFNDEQQKVLQSVWDTYGDMTGNSLEVLTHTEPPWIEARKGYTPTEICKVVISNQTMKEYYRSIYEGEEDLSD